MQQGQRPVGVGFFLSLGHSAVVVLSVGRCRVRRLGAHITLNSLKAVGGIIGTSASALFLFTIALINILVLISVYRTFQAVNRGRTPFAEDDFDILAQQEGVSLSHLSPAVPASSPESWHMLAIGFLFGLGSKPRRKSTLFGISFGADGQRHVVEFDHCVPGAFTAGMSLVDTTDGVLMLGAYGWAFMKPVRKPYYNMTITAVSVIVALIIGGLETLNLIGDKVKLGLTDGGGFWGAIGEINDSFGVLGYVIIGVFLMSWVGSMLSSISSWVTMILEVHSTN